MTATGAMSIAALVAALVATPSIAFAPGHETGADADANEPAGPSLGCSGIDASSVSATDLSADGSVDVYEG